ncbi:hypothetical protein BABINDRAFT_5378 [Babjeviella inositovora NRRL Y-12698]|uniref:Cytochrome b5 heme-binding domain-containing protein n=1 Tax=Babjeviella inositovora NRRL Y-12698 TaxID=984486 RepID=A0A1E3QXK3_9ASCO|nr:uncharacterized protein BABINDRAFT_5378 [Babjeviella inositovora NRRL Y-12698]ODQ82405.1 hypothetical protein BABINDRAFT_5378 [Babjeviella inositovora NRRL Y-12698]
MSPNQEQATEKKEKGKFMPKVPVQLDPPKDAWFTREELSQYDGVKSDKIYVGIKGTVFDVSKNTKSYGPNAGYSKLAGKDASKALGKTSLKDEDVDPATCWDYSDLSEKHLKALDDWYTFFENRYNIVGKVIDHR